MLVGNEFEVDHMDERPNLPRSLTGTQQIVLDFGRNRTKTISIDKTQIGKEDGHEDGTPEDLINGNLAHDTLQSSTLNLGIQPIVKVMSRGTMVGKSKETQRKESFHIEGVCLGNTCNEDLSKQITKGPTNKRGTGLGRNGIGIQSSVVGSPTGDSSTTNTLTTEQRRFRSAVTVVWLLTRQGTSEGRFVGCSR